MILAITIALVYMTGTSATMFQKMNEGVEREWDNIYAGREPTSEWILAPLAVWTVVCGLLWPAYWTARLLYAVPEQLALNPGEPQ